MNNNKISFSCVKIHGNIALGKIVYFDHRQDSSSYSVQSLDDIFSEIEKVQDDEFIQYGEIKRSYIKNFRVNESIIEHVFPIFDSFFITNTFKSLVYTEKMNISSAFEEAVEMYLFSEKNIMLSRFQDQTEEILNEVRILKNRLMVRFEVMLLQRLIKGIDDHFVLVVNEFKKDYFYNLPENIQGFICKKVTEFELARSLAHAYELPIVVHNHAYIEGELVIIDAFKQLIIIKPTKEDVNFYQKEIRRYTYQIGETPTYNQSKINIYVPLVDTRNLKRIASSSWYNGVAPFRSEFMYVAKGITPTFEEQEEMFITLLSAMKEKEVYIRVPDFRPERPTPFIEKIYTDMETLVEYYELYNINLMAIASAVQYTKKEVHIVIPMIRLSNELPFWRDAVEAAFEMYNQKPPKVGIMMETESALQYHEDYTKMDFVIIGLNDLIEELSDEFNRYSDMTKEEIIEILWPDIRDLHQHLRSYKMRLKHIVSGNFLKNPEVFRKFLKSGFTDFSIPLNTIRLLEETLKNHNEVKGTFVGVAAERIEQKKIKQAKKTARARLEAKIQADKEKSILEKKAQKEKEVRDSHKEKREEVISEILSKNKKDNNDDENK